MLFVVLRSFVSWSRMVSSIETALTLLLAHHIKSLLLLRFCLMHHLVKSQQWCVAVLDGELCSICFKLSLYYLNDIWCVSIISIKFKGPVKMSVSPPMKAAVWSFEKKVDLARKFDWAQFPDPSFILCTVCSPASNAPPHTGVCCAEQACNHGNRRSQVTKRSYSK